METWEVLAVDTAHTITIRAEGKKIDGVKLLLRDPAAVVGDRTRFRGFAWIEQFISNERLQKLAVTPMPGDMIQLVFNRYGDIIEINPVN